MTKIVSLRISPSLTLPIDAVTGTHVVYGRKRKGKTYKAKVLAEEMLRARQQIVVIDPTDAWWGLQSSADGTAAGFPITIFGGRHANLPLEPTAGEELADVTAEDTFSSIFSLKGMSRANEQRFCYSFLERLFRRNPQKPLHIFMDEADIYAPQNPFGDEARTLGATQNMVRRGGLDGLGMTLITQRPAVLHKGVSSQCDMLISVGLNDPRDLDAVKDWVNANYEDRELSKKLMIDIPQLGRPENKGIAWVLSPDRDIAERVMFRELRTFDSSRTPKVGEKRSVPRVLSKVDLDHLGKRIAATVEQAKANDPKLLKAELARLKKANEELAAGAERAIQAGLAKGSGKPAKVIERPVIKAEQLKRIDAMIAAGDRVIERWDDVSADAHGALEQVRAKAGELFGGLRLGLSELRNAVLSTQAAPAATGGAWSKVTNPAGKEMAVRNDATSQKANANGMHSSYVEAAGYRVRPPTTNGHARASTEIVGADGEPFKIVPAMQKILDALARLEQINVAHPPKKQVALFAATSPKSSSYTNNLGALRSAGLISYPTGGAVALTESGRALANSSQAPQSLDEIHAFVRELVGDTRWRILQALIDAGSALKKPELAIAAGTTAESSSYTNNLGSLRTLGLLDYPMPGQVAATEIMLRMS